MKETLILTVDRNRCNVELLAQFLNKEGYQSLGANTLEEFKQALSSTSAKIKFVLVDVADFDRSIWELCQRLQDEQIPFIVISPRQSASIQQQSFAHGARSMLVKPLVVRELLGLIRSLLGDQV